MIGMQYQILNVQKKQIHEEEERRELRITDSLIDEEISEDSDSGGSGDDDGNDNKPLGYYDSNNDQLSKISSHQMNIKTNCTEEDGSNNCQTPLNTTTNLANTTCDKSTALQNNTTVVNSNTSNNKANLLDEEIVGQQALQDNDDLLIDDDDHDSLEENVYTKSNSRRHSSDTFMSVYEDLATKRRRTASLGSSQSQPIQVTQNNSTRYNNNNTAKSRGRQVKTLVTTALQTVAEGLVVVHNSCNGVGTWDVDKVMPMSGNKRMSIENSSNNNNNQRRNNRRKSLNIRAELTLQEEECAVLKQKLETSRAEMEALQRDRSITVQSNAILESKLKHSQTKVEKLRKDLKTERRVQSDHHQTTKQERGIKSRLELQNEIDTMRKALNEIKQVEGDRLKRTKCIETELHEAKSMISSLKEENESLRAAAQSEMMNEEKISLEKKVEWKESCGEGMEGIEVLTNDGKTPKKTDLDAINSLGAAYTPPRKTKEKGKSKENKQASGECSLCFRQPKSNGVVKYCQCGKISCNKWAHETCLMNRKSVSSVSHPGSPMPYMPTILCDGIYCKEI